MGLEIDIFWLTVLMFGSLAILLLAGLPLSFVTARGHSRDTIKAGIRVLFEAGLIEKEPNYLEIFAVNNRDMQQELLDSVNKSGMNSRAPNASQESRDRWDVDVK